MSLMFNFTILFLTQPASNLKTVAAVSLGSAAAKAAGLQPTGSIVVNTQQGVQGNLPHITRKLQAGQTVVGSLAQNVIAASTVRKGWAGGSG